MRSIQGYILKGKNVYVGLEDSKKTWKLCVRSEGVVVNECSMPAVYGNLRNYFINRFPECHIHVLYEAGFRGFGLHDQLVSDGWECTVTPPHTVTDEKCQRQKNDRIDCRRLAKNLENSDYKSCYVPDQEQREDRQLSRTYEQIKHDITRVKSRIRRTLEYQGLDHHFPAGKWGEASYRELIELLDTIDISSSLRISLTIMIRELEQLQGLRKELIQCLKGFAKKDRYKDSIALLKSAPGIGLLTAIRLVLEWGDLSRFKRKEQFTSFLGLTPSEYSSGEKELKGHITKQGNRQVRAWLIECSWAAIKKDPVLLDKYRRVYNHCGSKKKAIVAVARKLALRLRSLLLSKQPYAIGIIA